MDVEVEAVDTVSVDDVGIDSAGTVLYSVFQYVVGGTVTVTVTVG